MAEGEQGCTDDGCRHAGDDSRHAGSDSRYAGNDSTHVLCGVRVLEGWPATFCEGGCFLVISYKLPGCTETTAQLTQKELSSGNCLTTRDRLYIYICLFFPDSSPVKSGKVGGEIVQSRKERQKLSASASFQPVSPIGQPSQSPLTGKPEKQNKARVNREPSQDRRSSWQGA